MKFIVVFVLVFTLALVAYLVGKNSTSTQTPIVATISPVPTISVTVSVSPSPVAVKLLPTAGWTTTGNKVFSIKYPAETFTPITTDKYIQLRWKNNTGELMLNSPNFLMANNYTGGSRREWYINSYSYYTNEVVFTEKTLGRISVLEAKPKNQKSIQNILVSDGKTLIDVGLNGADLNLVETIVSTMVFK